MTEGGVTPLGYNAHSIHDGPYNPHSPTKHYSGGSSSGSAVAVSTGLTTMSIGWDGGGSVRIPAAMSGVIGLATTFGRVPFEQSNSGTNIKAGPLCTSMNDIALSYLLLGQVYNTTTDTSTSTSTSTTSATSTNNGQRQRRRKKVFYNELFGEAYLPSPHLTGVVVPPSSSSSSSSSSMSTTASSKHKPLLDGIRLGIFWDHFQHTDKDVYEKCLKVVEFLQSPLIGATIVNITIPYLKEIHLSHGSKILTEFGITWENQFYNSSYVLESNTDISIKLGRTITADEILAAEKIRTFAILYVRNVLFGTNGKFGLKLDSIISPALGVKVPKLPTNSIGGFGYRGYGESNVPLLYKIMRYVPLANFLGLPALSIPIGYHDSNDNDNDNDSDSNDKDYDGLPIGFQFMSDAWNEPMLIKLGYIIEQYYLDKNNNNNNRQHATTTTGGGSTIRKPPNENYFDVLKPWLG
jgi:Asp-tRNA(Asn)/Glu-tRNA(Gln) amidotransferase A subunit family amidase